MAAVVTALTLWIAPVAQAADLGHGGQIFGNNCVACHIGGGNVVNIQNRWPLPGAGAVVGLAGADHSRPWSLQQCTQAGSWF